MTLEKVVLLCSCPPVLSAPQDKTPCSPPRLPRNRPAAHLPTPRACAALRDYNGTVVRALGQMPTLTCRASLRQIGQMDSGAACHQQTDQSQRSPQRQQQALPLPLLLLLLLLPPLAAALSGRPEMPPLRSRAAGRCSCSPMPDRGARAEVAEAVRRVPCLPAPMSALPELICITVASSTMVADLEDSWRPLQYQRWCAIRAVEVCASSARLGSTGSCPCSSRRMVIHALAELVLHNRL